MWAPWWIDDSWVKSKFTTYNENVCPSFVELVEFVIENGSVLCRIFPYDLMIWNSNACSENCQIIAFGKTKTDIQRIIIIKRLNAFARKTLTFTIFIEYLCYLFLDIASSIPYFFYSNFSKKTFSKMYISL